MRLKSKLKKFWEILRVPAAPSLTHTNNNPQGHVLHPWLIIIGGQVLKDPKLQRPLCVSIFSSSLLFILPLNSHRTEQSKVVKFGTLVEGSCQESMANRCKIHQMLREAVCSFCCHLVVKSKTGTFLRSFLLPHTVVAMIHTLAWLNFKQCLNGAPFWKVYGDTYDQVIS